MSFPAADIARDDESAATKQTNGASKMKFDLRHLDFFYGEHRALKNVNLQLADRAITAFIGPSGCGKSTLLRILNRMYGLYPGQRATGEVLLDGENILLPGVDVTSLRFRVGMVFQKPTPFPLSIYRNIELPLREYGITRRADINVTIEQVLQDVGLWEEVHDRLNTSALSLSGGQQQRLCIARALALDPQILLMDEPCSALDPIASGVVEDLISRLCGRYTIVIVTHNLAQARRIANYAAFFWIKNHAGRLVEFGNCRQIFESPTHELTAAYINGARG